MRVQHLVVYCTRIMYYLRLLEISVYSRGNLHNKENRVGTYSVISGRIYIQEGKRGRPIAFKI